MSVYKGILQKGSKRGHTLGFPTANIPLDDVGASGIYVARVVFDGKEYHAAAFADQNRNILEAHILDADLDLYGKEITVELLKKIRDNKMFENDDDLRAAIADDVIKIRAYLKNI